MKLKDIYQKALNALKRRYKQADDLTDGALEIIRVTFERFTEERGSEAAPAWRITLFLDLPDAVGVHCRRQLFRGYRSGAEPVVEFAGWGAARR
jgi:hypothetical protein